MHSSSQHKHGRRHGFTLIEILIVIVIVSILMSFLGVTIANMLTTAKEAQTQATLTKIDGMITERQEGMARFYDSRDFRRRVDEVHDNLKQGDPSNGVPQLLGLSQGFVKAVGIKKTTQEFFPQNFFEMTDIRQPIDPSAPAGSAARRGIGADGIPDKIAFDDVYGTSVKWGIDPSDSVLKPWRDKNGNAMPDAGDVFHQQETESAELLYFALTRLEIFGVPAIGADAFLDQEVDDTDGDGLPEFVDGWGRPLRFYRWPSRLIKPFGMLGQDGSAGNPGDDDGNGESDVITFTIPGTSTPIDVPDPQEISWPGSDDVVILKEVRAFAALYFDGLPRQPIMVGTPPNERPVVGDYDMLNEDGDDPFGIMLAEARRLTATGIPLLVNVSETRFHTLDTFHKPLVVSAGADGVLGLYEPFHNEDINFDGLYDPAEDVNGNGYLDIGFLAQPFNEDFNYNGVQDAGEPDLNANLAFDSYVAPVAALDDITNRNRRAGE